MTRLARLSFLRFIELLFLLLVLGLLTLLGLDLLIAHNWVQPLIDAERFWVSPRLMDSMELLVLAVVATSLPLLYFLIVILRRKLERGIVGRGSDGKDICLAASAVDRTILREIRAYVPEVVRVRTCTAIQGSSAPRIDLDVIISDRATVPVVQDKIRGVINEVLTRLIGFADGNQTRVKVSEVAGAALPARNRKAKSKDA